jgi:hypothetical protein
VTRRAILLGAISAAMLTAYTTAAAWAVDDTGVDFADSRLGAPPEDFDFGVTGGGQPGQWTVVRDVTAMGGAAVEQSSHDPSENQLRFAIYRPLSLKNLTVRMRFKLIEGTMQTAGIAFRFVDVDNYYVASANALEGRVDIFRVLAGKMERIGGTEADVSLRHWQALGLVADGDKFALSLDGTPLFVVSDRTFLADGRIGLWTEEDNVTRFDQLEITALPWSQEER